MRTHTVGGNVCERTRMRWVRIHCVSLLVRNNRKSSNPPEWNQDIRTHWLVDIVAACNG
jgi:hypothetical protein